MGELGLVGDGPAAPVARPVTPTTILAQRLAVLRDGLAASPGMDPALLDIAKRAADLAGGLDPYCAASSTAESPELAELADRTRRRAWDGGREQEMLSGHVEGQLLKFLVQMSGARRVLEIGMFTGYAALAMAEALPADGVVVSCEIDPETAAFARSCLDASPAGTKVDVRVGPAGETLAGLARDAAADPARAFDFCFLDADKASYPAYLDALLDTALLAPGAVIAVDNTLMQGEPYLPGGTASPNGAAIAGFNAAVAADPRVEQVLVPIRDGLTLIRRLPGARP